MVPAFLPLKVGAIQNCLHGVRDSRACQVIRQVEGLTNLFRRLSLDDSCQRTACQVHQVFQTKCIGRARELAQPTSVQFEVALVEEFPFLGGQVFSVQSTEFFRSSSAANTLFDRSEAM